MCWVTYNYFGNYSMSNWFENNPTKSVISYTLIIIAATWATSTFVLQDNRINLLRSEIDSQKTLTEQYKSKAELIQHDLESVRQENVEYRTWLGQTKDAIPAIVPRLTELKNKIAKLEIEAGQLRDQNPSTLVSGLEQTVRLGRAFIDETTGVIVTVKKTFPDLTAELIIKLPDRSPTIEQTIRPGQQWKFVAQAKPYTLTVTEIQFIGDSVNIRIIPTQ